MRDILGLIRHVINYMKVMKIVILDQCFRGGPGPATSSKKTVSYLLKLMYDFTKNTQGDPKRLVHLGY
jgi:hypothetical protein